MKFRVSFILCFIPMLLFAQESEIVISEAKLQQLADKLYQIKQERQQKQATIFTDGNFLENHQNQQRLNELKRNYTSVETESISSTEINKLRSEIATLTEILTIEKSSSNLRSATPERTTKEQKNSARDEENLLQLEEISTALKLLEQKEASNSAPRQERVVVNVPRSVTQNIVGPVDRKATTDTLYINDISTQKDSLALLEEATKNRKMLEQENAIAKITTQLHLLHQKIDELQNNLKTDPEVQVVEVEKIVQVENKTTSENEAYQARLKKYGDYKTQVFFANNSFSIDAKYNEEITELKAKLNTEAKIDAVIEGYASKRGDVLYNEELSMKRAIALKRKLMDLGIPPKRILTDYKGVDENATSEAEARRLDIRFLVRE